MTKSTLFAFLLTLASIQLPPGLSGLLNPGSQSSDPAGPPAISTTFADTYQQVPALDAFNPANPRSLEELPRTNDGSFVLQPGAYSSALETFCLDVGAHAPDTDAAYVIAPLKGPQSAEIQSLLTRAYTQPDIAQDNVQMLVWSITSHVDLANLSTRLQQMAQRLMSATDQANVNSAAAPASTPPFLASVLALMPPQARASLQALLSSRSALASGTDSYDQVAGGLSTPAPANNAGVPRARWAYLAPGYFVRFQSTTYQTSTLQLYVPEGWTVQRDASRRLTSLQSKQGSSIMLTYGSGGTTVQFNEPFGTVPGLVRQGQAVVTYSGTEQDNAKALQALGAAITASPAPSAAWNGLHDAAAAAAASAQTDLLCQTMACDVGKPGTPPAVFSTANVIASPSDSSLQPLAMAARPAGGTAPAPTAVACKPIDQYALDESIPAECLIDLPRRPPLPSECDDVAEQIRGQELAQGAYAKGAKDGTWDKLNLYMYGRESRQAADDAITHGMAGVTSGQVGVTSSGINQGGSSGNSNPSGGNSGAHTDVLGDTDMYSCSASEADKAFGLLPIERQGIDAHEAEHVATCESWKAQRAQAATLPPDKRPSDSDTPHARAEDEVRAYGAGLKVLRTWYAAHCGKK